MPEQDTSTTYLELLNINSDSALQVVLDYASRRNDEEHLIRSVILDMHLSVEQALRELLYHVLRPCLLFVDDNDRDNKARKLNKSVEGVRFGVLYSLLESVVHDSPWPDLRNAKELNKTRNQLAHREDIKKIKYKGRDPFTCPDCLAEMYFDVWAFNQSFRKLFERVVEEPYVSIHFYRDNYNRYREEFGELAGEAKMRDYPEW